MGTARDIINASLRKLGVLAAGEAASASEASDALRALNNLLDSWSNENLLIFAKVRESFPMVAGTSQYTMGSGATFDTARPQKIENALVQENGSSPQFEVPMRIVGKDEFAAITVKDNQSDIPQILYVEYNNPNAILNLWPVPGEAKNIILYSWKALTTFTNLNTAASFPPGYERALEFNLAIDLAPEYGVQVSQVTFQNAMESKAAIKRMNTTDHLLGMDAAVRPRGSGWNWLMGDHN